MSAIELIATGMVTPIGHTTAEAYTSMESGLRRFRETPIRGLDGGALVASLVLPVTPENVGLRRALAIAYPAVAECIAGVTGPWGQKCALLLCLPRPRSPLPAPFCDVYGTQGEAWSQELLPVLATSVESEYGLTFAVREEFLDGHAAGIVGLQRAMTLLNSGEVEHCLLGGVETRGERGILEELDFRGELKSARVPHGVIPGEAACFLCLRRASAISPPGHSALPQILGVAVARDAEGASVPATGLTEALETVFSRCEVEPQGVSFVMSDMNGERERAKEMTFAAMRTLWRRGALPELLHPADRFGDVGGATGPLLLGLTARRVVEEPLRRFGLVVSSTLGIVHGAAVVGGPERSSP